LAKSALRARRRCEGEGTATAWTWLETLAGELWRAQTTDDVTQLVVAANEAWATPHKDLPDDVPRRTQTRRRAVDKALAYFTGNAAWMGYSAFRAQDIPASRPVLREIRCPS
jgi:hypothetical protein